MNLFFKLLYTEIKPHIDVNKQAMHQSCLLFVQVMITSIINKSYANEITIYLICNSKGINKIHIMGN